MILRVNDRAGGEIMAVRNTKSGKSKTTTTAQGELLETPAVEPEEDRARGSVG